MGDVSASAAVASLSVAEGRGRRDTRPPERLRDGPSELTDGVAIESLEEAVVVALEQFRCLDSLEGPHADALDDAFTAASEAHGCEQQLECLRDDPADSGAAGTDVEALRRRHADDQFKIIVRSATSGPKNTVNNYNSDYKKYKVRKLRDTISVPGADAESFHHLSHRSGLVREQGVCRRRYA